MRKAVFTGLLFIISSVALASVDSLFQQANRHFQNNEIEPAIKKYLQIIDSGFHAPELYFNLGNAYFKTNNIAKAILYCEKAKLLDPKNEDVLFNLDLANSYITDKIEAIPVLPFINWYKNFIRVLSSDTWAYLSMIMFIIMLALTLIYLFTKNIFVKKLSFWLAVLSLIVSIGTFIFAKQHQKMLVYRDYAIITSPSVTAKSTPDESGTDLFVIHEGLKVRVEDILGGWCEIKLSDGNKGWVRLNSLEYI